MIFKQSLKLAPTKVSTCDNSVAVRKGILADEFFGQCCVFTNVLNMIDSESRKEMEGCEGQGKLANSC